MNSNLDIDDVNSRLTYNDLQDATYSANTKFELVALTSVAVSYLDLACNSSIFGLRFEGLNERLIECGFVLASLALFLNYWLRYLDEGKVFSHIEKDLAALRGRINKSMVEIKNSINVSDITNDISSNIDGLNNALNRIQGFESPGFDKLTTSFTSTIKKYEKEKSKADALKSLPADLDPHGLATSDATIHYNAAEMLVNDMSSLVKKFDQELKQIQSLNGEVETYFYEVKSGEDALRKILGLPKKMSNELSELSKSLETISVGLIESDVKPAKAKFRIGLFMYFWPWTLTFLVILSFVYAWFTQDHEACQTISNLALNKALG